MSCRRHSAATRDDIRQYVDQLQSTRGRLRRRQERLAAELQRHLQRTNANCGVEKFAHRCSADSGGIVNVPHEVRATAKEYVRCARELERGCASCADLAFELYLRYRPSFERFQRDHFLTAFVKEQGGSQCNLKQLCHVLWIRYLLYDLLEGKVT